MLCSSRLLPRDEQQCYPRVTPQKQILSHPKLHLNCHKNYLPFPRKARAGCTAEGAPIPACQSPTARIPQVRRRVPLASPGRADEAGSPSATSATAGQGLQPAGGGASSQERSLHTRGQQRNADERGQGPGGAAPRCGGERAEERSLRARRAGAAPWPRAGNGRGGASTRKAAGGLKGENPTPLPDHFPWFPTHSIPLTWTTSCSAPTAHASALQPAPSLQHSQLHCAAPGKPSAWEKPGENPPRYREQGASPHPPKLGIVAALREKKQSTWAHDRWPKQAGTLLTSQPGAVPMHRGSPWGLARQQARPEQHPAAAAPRHQCHGLQSGWCSPLLPNHLSANMLLVCKADSSENSPSRPRRATSRQGSPVSCDDSGSRRDFTPLGAMLCRGSQCLFIEHKPAEKVLLVTANPGNNQQPLQASTGIWIFHLGSKCIGVFRNTSI